MRISYDKEADALYIRLIEGDYQVRVVRLTDDIALDMADGERLVGIEILGASNLFERPDSPEVDIQALIPRVVGV
jgi:uncharacterized protein YuzE